MTEKEYEKRFEKLYSLFTEAYLYFYTWKALQEKEYEKTYEKNSTFWAAVMHSLENTWLSFLAKIFEESKFSEKSIVISVQALIPYQIDKTRAKKANEIVQNNKTIIENIIKLRHNQIAHNNADHLINPKKILDRHPIRYKDVEKLLKISGKILSLLNLKQGHGYMYDSFANTCEAEVENLIKKLQYFESLKEDYLNKFVNGEVTEPHFPPGKML